MSISLTLVKENAGNAEELVSLGDVRSVKATLSRHFPKIEWRLAVGNLDGIDFSIEFSIGWRGLGEKSERVDNLYEQLEDDRLSGAKRANLEKEIEHWMNVTPADDLPVDHLGVSIRGSNHAAVAIRDLCAANMWTALDDSTGDSLDWKALIK